MITVFSSSECFVRGMFMSEIQLLYYTIPKVFNIYSHLINTELRDKYPSLDALCEDREITKTTITDTLKGIDYEYDNIRNQFV